MAGLNNNLVATIGLIKILMRYTDESHQLKTNELIKKLEEEYEVSFQRGAIERRLHGLADADIYIEHGDNGWYYDSRNFDKAELRLLIDCVLSSRHISNDNTKKLIHKLCSEESDYYKKTLKYISSVEKWDNNSENIFYKIDGISRAIEEKKVIYFKMLRRDENLNLVEKGYVRISPYTMLMSNQHYYVMGYNEYWKEMVFIRIDKIKEVHIDEINEHHYIDIRSIRGYENGIDYNELSVARPYLFADKIDRVTLKVKKRLIDQVVDWYGTKLDIKTIDDDYVQIKLKTSPEAMKYWALQYINDVEVIEPLYIREEVGKTISANLEKYKDVISSQKTNTVASSSTGSFAFVNFDDLSYEKNNEIEDLTEGMNKK